MFKYFEYHWMEGNHEATIQSPSLKSFLKLSRAVNIYFSYTSRVAVAARTEDAVTKILCIKSMWFCLWAPNEPNN